MIGFDYFFVGVVTNFGSFFSFSLNQLICSLLSIHIIFSFVPFYFYFRRIVFSIKISCLCLQYDLPKYLYLYLYFLPLFHFFYQFFATLFCFLIHFASISTSYPTHSASHVINSFLFSSSCLPTLCFALKTVFFLFLSMIYERFHV
jgi:ABC-type lipoprotein release transport system permease subunit